MLFWLSLVRLGTAIKMNSQWLVCKLVRMHTADLSVWFRSDSTAHHLHGPVESDGSNSLVPLRFRSTCGNIVALERLEAVYKSPGLDLSINEPQLRYLFLAYSLECWIFTT